MSTEPREEVERLPADDTDLEAGTPGLEEGRENSKNHGADGVNGTRQSSTESQDPEKKSDVEIVDWDGPNDPENP